MSKMNLIVLLVASLGIFAVAGFLFAGYSVPPVAGQVSPIAATFISFTLIVLGSAGMYVFITTEVE